MCTAFVGLHVQCSKYRVTKPKLSLLLSLNVGAFNFLESVRSENEGICEWSDTARDERGKEREREEERERENDVLVAVLQKRVLWEEDHAMNHSITPSPGLASGKLSLVPQAADRDFAQMSTTVDFSTIDDMDPSLADGHHVYFEREVPFELRVQSSDSEVDGGDAPGSLEAIKVKILLRGVDSCPESVRVELSSEGDLFFHYVHEVRDRDYREVQETQRLMVDFSDYASVLVRMLNQVCLPESKNKERLDTSGAEIYRVALLLQLLSIVSFDTHTHTHILLTESRLLVHGCACAFSRTRTCGINVLSSLRSASRNHTRTSRSFRWTASRLARDSSSSRIWSTSSSSSSRYNSIRARRILYDNILPTDTMRIRFDADTHTHTHFGLPSS